MNTNDITIRLESKEEYREVENLIRESFWNVYRPGCSEHYVIHVLRDDPAFVKELDFVMEQNGKLIGQNMFMRTIITADDDRDIDVLTMGPICITPELKRQGYGKLLLDYSLSKATELGFGAVLFEGNIDFYGKSGFDYARKFGIRYHDLPEDADDSFFLCKELVEGYLDGITGVYQTPQGYYVDDAEVEAFDRSFPFKEKRVLPGQIFKTPEAGDAKTSEARDIKDTKLYFLEKDCLKLFGPEEGRSLYSKVNQRYNDLCNHSDFRNNKEIEYHLTMNLYPAMSYYQVLLENGLSKEEALMYVRKETVQAANIKKAEQQKTAKLPFAYLMYRLFVKSVMKKKFPKEGWDIHWVRCDGKEIHFDMTRCIYKDICDEENCPELCMVFCENDDIAFSGLMPKIRFERTGTLGDHAQRCDFHFIKI